MSTNPHRLLLGLLPWLLAVGLATCGAPQATTPTPTSAPPPLVTARADARTTLILWHAWPSPEQYTLSTLVDRYNQTHAGVHIVLQAMPLASLTTELRTAALANSGPHLVLLQSHTIGTLAQEGLLLPITDAMVPTSEQDGLLGPALASARAQDSEGLTRLYGVPITFDTLALYYRTDRLATPPADTDALIQAAHRLADPTSNPPTWGLAYTLSLDKTIGYLPAFNGRIFDARGSIVLGSAGLVGTRRWLEWLQTLQQDPQILAASDSIAIDSVLKAQQATMTIDWSHTLATYQALWGEDLGVAPLPTLSSTGLPPQPYVQSDLLCISTRVVAPAEQAATLDFLRYLLSAEAQRDLLHSGNQPTLLALPLRSDIPAEAAARAFRTQARRGQPMPNNHLANEFVRGELERMQLAVLRGQATPIEAIIDTSDVLREHFGRSLMP